MPIRWDEFEKLCAIQCTLEEIAAYFNCSADTIERAVKRHYKSGFADVFAQKRGHGKVSLRRVQFQKALEGNPTMMIWLGKQYLGQTEKVEQKVETVAEHIVYQSEWATPKDKV